MTTVPIQEHAALRRFAALRIGLISLALGLLVACSAGPTSSSDSDSPAELAGELQLIVDSSDIFFVMEQGGGSLDGDEMLADFGVVAGTATEVATLQTSRGEWRFITAQSRGIVEQGNEIRWCLIDVGPSGNQGASCGFDPLVEPGRGSVMVAEHPDGWNAASYFGGVNAVLAVFELPDDRIIAVATAGGLAAAEWPSAWGLPTLVTFYDESGEVVYTQRRSP